MIENLKQFLRRMFKRGSNVIPPVSPVQLETLRQEYLVLAEQLSAPRSLVQFHTMRQDDGSAHMEMSGDKFQYVVTERGQTLRIRSSTDRSEALFWLLKDLTGSMARDFELVHRVAGKDSRRLRFAKHVELLQLLNYAWAERVASEYDSILVNHPFDDCPLTDR